MDTTDRKGQEMQNQRGHEVKCETCGIVASYPITGWDWAFAAAIRHEDRDLWGPRRKGHTCSIIPRRVA